MHWIITLGQADFPGIFPDSLASLGTGVLGLALTAMMGGVYWLTLRRMKRVRGWPVAVYAVFYIAVWGGALAMDMHWLDMGVKALACWWMFWSSFPMVVWMSDGRFSSNLEHPAG